MKCEIPDCTCIATTTARVSVNNSPKLLLRVCAVHAEAASEDTAEKPKSRFTIAAVPLSIPDLAELTELARRVARDAHHNQTRSLMKKTGTAKLATPPPYFDHVESVANNVSAKAKPVAYLHDVIDENPHVYPITRLRDMFPSWITDRLVLLSRANGDDYDTHIVLLSQDWLCREVKIEDLKDNLSDLVKGTLRDKYRLSLHLLGVTP